MPDRSGQTEQATPHRLKKAREDGQFPAAREFVAALQFLAFVALAAGFGRGWLDGMRRTMRWLLRLAFARELRPQDVTAAAWTVFRANLLPLALGGMTLAVVTLGVRLMTTGFGLSLKKLAFDPQRFNPLSRLQELPRQNLPALMQAVIMLPLFLWAAYAVAREKLDAFLMLPLGGVESGAALLGSSLIELLWKAAAVFLVFGAVDLGRQLRRYRQDLRMSRQQIKEEFKESEGNPQIKGRIRRLQRDRARRRMMQEVATATAVVVNPTHFAVALRYRMEDTTAPVVVAKGKNYLAQRIRERAVSNQVPVVENPPLARALYKSVEVGQEIPPHLYRAVAEILAYIFKLMNGRLPG
jgi:flagellar biosynthesis protein FlhB